MHAAPVPANPARIEKAKNPRQRIAAPAALLGPFTSYMIGLVLGLVVIYTLLGLVGPYLMGVAIDRFIGGKDPAGLTRTAIWMLGLYLVNNFFRRCQLDDGAYFAAGAQSSCAGISSFTCRPYRCSYL